MRFPFAFGLPPALAFALVAAVAPAQADPVFVDAQVDFTGSSTMFGYLGTQFTFTDVSNGAFTFDPVAVTTASNAAVTAFGPPFYSTPTPTTYFDPVRGSGSLVFDAGYLYSSFTSPTTIPYSASPSFIGLALTLVDGVHYGFARFAGTYLVSYGFESIAGVGIDAAAVAAVPEPETWALLIGGLGVLGAIGRRRRLDTAPAA